MIGVLTWKWMENRPIIVSIDILLYKIEDSYLLMHEMKKPFAINVLSIVQ